ncbi:MAG: ParB/RepB/Spo0J family partition protein [Blastocatellales bacterium]
MSLQSVSLSQLVPSKANPRKLFDVSALEGLAASISTDGLLQNLVVTPANGKGKRYTIISGERRYRALKLLEQRGKLPAGFTVPVEIRTRLTKEESIRLSTVENLQRADLTPLEQTAALTKLVKDGGTLEDVAAQTGLSETTIKRRMALNGLCQEAKDALGVKLISLSQAEALTIGADEDQKRFVEDIGRGQCHSPDWIKSRLIGKRPSVADAIFLLDRYSGTFTTDLFATEETRYFDDAEQFLSLQKEAAAELAERHRATAAWVEVTEDWHLRDWQYEEAPEGESGGVLINISPRGEVEIVEGLMKTALDEETAEDLAENPVAPPRVKASYATPLRRIVAHCKGAAIGELLLASPRKAKEVSAVLHLMRFKPQEALPASEKQVDRQTPFAVLNTQARMLAQSLNLPLTDDQFGWNALRRSERDDTALYEAVKALSDRELDQLHTLLVALSFGQKDCEKLDTRDSLFNRVAQDLKADMRQHWKPDRAFLSRRTREQLIEIAKANGMADGRGALATYKKSELVEGILFHDANARLAVSPTPAQRKALEWLPEVMAFPAVDPDKPDAADEADADADTDEADDESGDAGDDDEFSDDDELREAA